MSSRTTRAIREVKRLQNQIPDWIYRFQSLRDVRVWVVSVLVSAIIGLWTGVLSALERVLAVFVDVPRIIFDSLAVVAVPFRRLLVALQSFQAAIESAAASAGLAGPFVALAGWLVPTLIVVALLNFVLGFAETYLPLESLPILGRWFR